MTLLEGRHLAPEFLLLNRSDCQRPIFHLFTLPHPTPLERVLLPLSNHLHDLS